MTFRSEIGHKKSHYLRDIGFESSALDALREYGFSECIARSAEGPSHWLLHKEGSQPFQDFSFEGIAELRCAGWQVDVGDDYPHQEIDAADWYLDLADTTAPSHWFDLELGVEIDGARHNLLPLLLGLLQASRLEDLLCEDAPATIQLKVEDGSFVRVSRDRLRQLTDVLVELHTKSVLRKQRLRMSTFQVGQLMALGDEDGLHVSITGSKPLVEWGKKLAAFDEMRPPRLPKGFVGELRPYQIEGLAWLQFLSDFGLSGLLADDMGLGKTLQVLAFIQAERQRGPNKGKRFRPNLVIAPTSVVHNWANEARRFFPGLNVFVHHGETRLESITAANEYDIVITSYTLLAREIEIFEGIEFHALVLDEAQAIKNPQTRAHQCVCRLSARTRLALTGTPVENHLGELWSLFEFLLPGLLGSRTDFRRKFRRPIEKHGDSLRMDALRNRVRPFVLRRVKTEVEKDLPPKTEIIRTVDLQGPQRDLYETVRITMDKRVRTLLKEKGLAKSSIEILDALLKLRQVCCHPALLRSDALKRVTTSAKLDQLLEVLVELLQEGRRVLLFSQFTSMLKLIEEELELRDIDYFKLTGATQKRQELIDAFQRGEAPVFLISLKAGGTGLNLTAADTAIHYDPWWNPAVENQATDRAHRIGQTHPIFVYKMICRETVEERIVELQRRKGALASSLLEGKGGLRGFTKQDIQRLFE